MRFSAIGRSRSSVSTASLSDVWPETETSGKSVATPPPCCTHAGNAALAVLADVERRLDRGRLHVEHASHRGDACLRAEPRIEAEDVRVDTDDRNTSSSNELLDLCPVLAMASLVRVRSAVALQRVQD